MPVLTRKSSKASNSSLIKLTEQNNSDKEAKKSKSTKTKTTLQKMYEISEETDELTKTTNCPFEKNIEISDFQITEKRQLSEVKSVFDEYDDKLKTLPQAYIPEYFLDILKYLLEKEEKNEWFSKEKKTKWRKVVQQKRMKKKNLQFQRKRLEKMMSSKVKNKSTIVKFQQKSDQVNWVYKYDHFAEFINQILQFLTQTKMKNSSYSCCYFFYLLIISDADLLPLLDANLDCGTAKTLNQYAITSIFFATKYHEVLPIWIESIIEHFDEKIETKVILSHQNTIISMMQFQHFFDDQEETFFYYFAKVLELEEKDINMCLYILQSGLNNPLLYEERPSYKAAAVILKYLSEKTAQKQKKSRRMEDIRRVVKISSEKESEIIQKYCKAIEYNKVNRVYLQRRKYFVYE